MHVNYNLLYTSIDFIRGGIAKIYDTSKNNYCYWNTSRVRKWLNLGHKIQILFVPYIPNDSLLQQEAYKVGVLLIELKCNFNLVLTIMTDLPVHIFLVLVIQWTNNVDGTLWRSVKDGWTAQHAQLHYENFAFHC